MLPGLVLVTVVFVRAHSFRLHFMRYPDVIVMAMLGKNASRGLSEKIVFEIFIYSMIDYMSFS